MLATITILIEKRHPIREFPTDFKLTLWIRVCLGQIAYLLFYTAVAMVPLTLINVISKLEAFFVFILGYLINGERIVPIEVLGILICFGTVVVLSMTDNEEDVETDDSGNLRTLGVSLGVLTAFFGGANNVLNRKLKDIPPSLIMVYNGFAGLVGMGVWILLDTYLSETGLRMLAYTKK